MREYLIGVTGVVLICAILSCVIPNGKNANFIQSILKLFCLLAIMSPLLYLFQNNVSLQQDVGNNQDFFLNSVIQIDSQFIKYYSELNVSHSADALSDELFNKFAIPVDVSLEWEYAANTIEDIDAMEKIKITKIYIQLKAEVNEKVRMDMLEYVINQYCSEVLIE